MDVGNVRLRVITDGVGLEALEPEWRGIYETSRCFNPFLSYEWLSSWWRHFGKGNQLCVVVAEQDGAPVSIAPLMRVEWAGFTKLQFLGQPFSDYGDFITTDGTNSGVEPLLEFLKYKLRWDALELRGIRGDSPNLPALQAAWPATARLNQWRRWTLAPFLPIRCGWSEYRDGRRKGLMSDTRRKIRRLEEKGELTYRECGTLERGLQLLDQFARQKSQRFAATGATDILANGAVLEFYKEVTRRLWDSGQVHISSLDLDHQPIATHFGFIAGQRYFYYMPSFDSTFSLYSPGRLIVFNLIENSFLKGLGEFDFMNGSEPYKYEWASDERPVYELRAFTRSPLGLALYGAHEVRRRARRSLLVRRSVRWARKRMRH